MIQKKDSREEYEIDLMRLLAALWRRIWVIGLAVVLSGVVTLGCTYFFVTPLYKSSALMYVNNSSFSVGSTSISLADLNASKSLVDTYIVILKTRISINEIIKRANVDYTYEQMIDKITAESVESTEIFRINVIDPNPETATRIANTITEVLPDRVADIMDGSSVRTVDFAVVPAAKDSPSLARNTAVGMLIGLLLSSAVLIIMELMDDQIHSQEYLTDTLGGSILAVIPDLVDTGSGKGYGYGYGSHYASSYQAAAKAKH